MVDLLSKVAFLHLLLDLGRNWEIFVNTDRWQRVGGGCLSVGGGGKTDESSCSSC